MELAKKRCVPCEAGVPPFTAEQARDYLAQLGRDWALVDAGRIRKEFRFKNFKAAMAFVNQVAEIAEAEGHHPDIHVVLYSHVMIEIWTHAIQGLSENDFILAAKIDDIPR